jgi:hypothetical protein
LNKTAFLLAVYLLLFSGEIIVAGTPQKPLKGKISMVTTDKVAYSVLYANVQRNSYANAFLGATGESIWKKNFKNNLDEPMASPVAVLTHEGNIGVQVNPYFLIYNENGGFVKWHYTKAVSSGIGIFLDKGYGVVEDNGSFDKLYTFAGNFSADIIPGAFIDDWWVPVLISPYQKGFILAQQYTGGPSRRPHEFKFSFYVSNYSGTFYGEKGEFSNVLLNSTVDKLVFTFQNQIHTLDPATGKKIKIFDPELPSMFKASLDLSNNLVIHAINKNQKEVYTSFDLNGTKLWEHEIESSVQNDQPPVCGEGGMVYYIGDTSLVCIKDGKKMWKSELFPCVNPLMTNSKGNNIIVQAGFHIMVYESNGKQKLKTLITKNMNEEFTAPPVIGGDGRIYTASGTALYCFK